MTYLRKITCLLIVAGVCLAGHIPNSAAGELQITLMKAKPAVVHIFVFVKGQIAAANGKVVWKGMISGGSGSGFLVNPEGYIVTNGHVVADAHESNEELMKLRALISFIQQKVIPQLEQKSKKRFTKSEKQRLVGKLYPKYKNLNVVLKKDIWVILSNKKKYPAEVKEYSPAVSSLRGSTGTMVRQVLPGINITTRAGKDVSILKIEGRNFPTVNLGDSDAVQIGETIHVIGYPAAAESTVLSQESKLVEQTITTGHISGGKVDIKGTPMVQTDANTIWGNSGGPCINGNGDVIGIVSYVGLAKGQAFSGFNWLVPINTAKEFIRAAGIDIQKKSLFDKEWGNALRLFSEAKYNEAEKAVKNVLVYMPQQPDARKLLLRIKEIAPEQQASSSFNSPMIIIGGLVALAVIIVVLLFVSKSGKKKATPPPRVEPVSKAASKPATGTAASIGVLIGRGGPLSNKTFELGPRGLKIGRDQVKNDIVVDDEEISREHAWIGMEQNKTVVKDLKSTNGTYVNAVSQGPVQKQDIKPGDIVILGKSGKVSFLYQKN